VFRKIRSEANSKGVALVKDNRHPLSEPLHKMKEMQRPMPPRVSVARRRLSVRSHKGANVSPRHKAIERSAKQIWTQAHSLGSMSS
jgi:hypothetical protein